jgi:hypothetical protein
MYVYFYSVHVSDSYVSIIGRSKLYQYDIWYMSLYVDDRLVCRYNLRTTYSPELLMMDG